MTAPDAVFLISGSISVLTGLGAVLLNIRGGWDRWEKDLWIVAYLSLAILWGSLFWDWTRK